jgi:hypothetical protein
MSNSNEHKLRDILPVPSDITRQYEGKFLIYSEEEGRVIGVGETEDEAYEQALASGVNGEWHFTYAFRSDEEIV